MPARAANDNNRLLTPEQAALRLNITEDQLSAFTHDGEIAYINVGRGKKRPRRRYAEDDIMEFLERRRRREVPCQSIVTSVRHTTNSISSTKVIGFMAARNARLDETRKGSRLPS
jgi:excisionase family DNA binding protein